MLFEYIHLFTIHLHSWQDTGRSDNVSETPLSMASLAYSVIPVLSFSEEAEVPRAPSAPLLLYTWHAQAPMTAVVSRSGKNSRS